MSLPIQYDFKKKWARKQGSETFWLPREGPGKMSLTPLFSLTPFFCPLIAALLFRKSLVESNLSATINVIAKFELVERVLLTAGAR